jgi:hypothetical protein
MGIMPIDWSKMYLKYKGLWVALQDDYTTVIASGPTPEAALKLAKQKGVSDPFLTRVPEKLAPFAG